ncbi:MAG: hypothetical protein WAW23_05115 [Candidatus Methanoperedens sp.]
MTFHYEPPTGETIDAVHVEEISCVIIASIEVENAVSEGIPCSDETIDILSRQIERKQTVVKKLEAMIEKTETLNNLNRNTLASLEELHSNIKKRIVEAEDINASLGRLAAVKGNSSGKK